MHSPTNSSWAGDLTFFDREDPATQYRLEERGGVLLLMRNGARVGPKRGKHLPVLAMLLGATDSNDPAVHKNVIYQTVWGRDPKKDGGALVSGGIDPIVRDLRVVFDGADFEARTQESRFIGIADVGRLRIQPNVEVLRDGSTAAKTTSPRPSGAAATAFQEFFGVSPSDEHPGVIILQSDLIHDVLGDFVGDLFKAAHTRMPERYPDLPTLTQEQTEALVRDAIKPSTRFYRARRWINAWDAAAGEPLREVFSQHKIKAPVDVFSVRAIRDNRIELGPVVFSMGLGFTNFTERILNDGKICRPWLRLRLGLPSEDALAFHEALRPAGKLTKFVTKDDEDGFFRVFPPDWEDDYMARWLTMLTTPTLAWPAQDYAMIFRHTNLRGPRKQVTFVLAGFTDRGTAVAGRYLASNWMNLHRRFFPKDQHDPSRGDFLLMIGGDSWPDDFEQWEEDPNFPAITPRRLYELGKTVPALAETDWAQRFSQRAKE